MTRRPDALRGVPCEVCGSTRSAATFWPGTRDRAVCIPNLDGRDRCRERERDRASAPSCANAMAPNAPTTNTAPDAPCIGLDTVHVIV